LVCKAIAKQGEETPYSFGEETPYSCVGTKKQPLWFAKGVAKHERRKQKTKEKKQPSFK
jgi:hypothetical protein